MASHSRHGDELRRFVKLSTAVGGAPITYVRVRMADGKWLRRAWVGGRARGDWKLACHTLSANDEAQFIADLLKRGYTEVAKLSEPWREPSSPSSHAKYSPQLSPFAALLAPVDDAVVNCDQPAVPEFTPDDEAELTKAILLADLQRAVDLLESAITYLTAPIHSDDVRIARHFIADLRLNRKVR